ncbi:uncharacterized protein METZ01_LOCUS476539, partial [marine metagenome]
MADDLYSISKAADALGHSMGGLE